MNVLKFSPVLPPAGLVLATCCIIFSAGCMGTTGPVNGGTMTGETWRTIELRDVQTGETFSVASLSGKPVILYTFTVSCPICTLQQKEISAFKKEHGEDVAVIGIDIDPKEEEAVLKSHIEKNGFLGYYTLSPPGMAGSLTERFGPVVVTPASAPVILVCPGGDARLLGTGIKTSAQLSSLIRAVC
ncbi:MAG TPA: TlpA disulfide reductase family protein [Methanolinea sp.]|nr:TlpA disulfide reductase family protein [Methanolinea sp.]